LLRVYVVFIVVLLAGVVSIFRMSVRSGEDAASGTAVTGTAAATGTGTGTASGTAAAENEFAADEEFEKKEKELKEKLPKGFKYTVVKPFLVVGNMSRRELAIHANYTIKIYMEAYYKGYFEKKPGYVLTVFLFKGDREYRKWAKELFNDTDVSHYGYYSPSDRALVMNISTGGGTLVHEMFHALVEPEFDDIPAWFNEGVASLYEACRLKEDGHINGMMNWRFPILKKGMEKGHYVPLRKLFKTTTSEFYDDEHGMHYGEARYFCMWLEKKGLLRKFYKTFREKYKEDPTGIKFLEELLGKKVEEFEKEWKEFVGTLKYER
jgi:hypothetical protein